VNIYQFRKLIGDAIGYGLYFCVLAFSDVVIRHSWMESAEITFGNETHE
jgi:hypothetical protein